MLVSSTPDPERKSDMSDILMKKLSHLCLDLTFVGLVDEANTIIDAIEVLTEQEKLLQNYETSLNDIRNITDQTMEFAEFNDSIQEAMNEEFESKAMPEFNSNTMAEDMGMAYYQESEERPEPNPEIEEVENDGFITIKLYRL